MKTKSSYTLRYVLIVIGPLNNSWIFFHIIGKRVPYRFFIENVKKKKTNAKSNKDAVQAINFAEKWIAYAHKKYNKACTDRLRKAYFIILNPLNPLQYTYIILYGNLLNAINQKHKNRLKWHTVRLSFLSHLSFPMTSFAQANKNMWCKQLNVIFLAEIPLWITFKRMQNSSIQLIVCTICLNFIYIWHYFVNENWLYCAFSKGAIQLAFIKFWKRQYKI